MEGKTKNISKPKFIAMVAGLLVCSLSLSMYASKRGNEHGEKSVQLGDDYALNESYNEVRDGIEGTPGSPPSC